MNLGIPQIEAQADLEAQGGEEMPTSVVITFIICVTLIALSLISNNKK